MSRIPAVEKVLQALLAQGGFGGLPRPLVTSLVRAELAALREGSRKGRETGNFQTVVSLIREGLEALERSRIQPVINGTGILIHTNLGRAPLSAEAAAAVREIARNYCNLELDLETGERGRRASYLERALALLCQAEAATVVNNCAAALILTLKHLAGGERNEVIISRGELVEIGGGFRVPEILEATGAVLREVGATNRTSLRDYEKAIGPRTGMLLKVHRSNFYMEGFVEEPPTDLLAGLAHQHGLPLVEDLGSGAMLATESLAAIPHEPTASEVLAQGADLVCVSGDKLLGGPQAGILAGSPGLIAGLKAQPLFRALRCDKLILAALQETVDAYLRPARGETPALPLPSMLQLDSERDLLPRAERLLLQLKDLDVSLGRGLSRCGGGTMPKAEIPSLTLEVRPRGMSVEEASLLLRRGHPPVIAYASGDTLRIDLRTVFPEQDGLLSERLQSLQTTRH